jgi:FMN-dependent oxidoreductase (nitrilotriacetate monooxygenase family)
MARQMIIGMHFGNGYGSQPGAWRMPGVDPTSYTNFDNQVRYAQAAERGKFQFLFVPDFPALKGDIDTEAPMITIDPILTLAAVARETARIGLVATGSTTFTEPYNLARQFKALDLMSHGRVGWNAVPSSDPAVAANYGREIPPRGEKYERLHESIQLVQALWGSWEQGAWLHDQASGQFANPDKIRPINLRGRHVGSSGPLPLPPSEQGQPVIFQAGGGDQGLEVAGRYASGVIGATHTILDARAQRMALRNAAERAGRDPDEVKFFPGLMTTIAGSRREGLDRRIALTERTFSQRVAYLGQMLNLRLDPARLGEPLSQTQLANARPSPYDPRAPCAQDRQRRLDASRRAGPWCD